MLYTCKSKRCSNAQLAPMGSFSEAGCAHLPHKIVIEVVDENLYRPLPACTTVVLQSRKAARQLHAYSNRALVEVARNLDALSRLPASHALITHLRIGSVARQSSVSTSIIPGRWRSSSSGTQAPRIAFIDTGRLTFHRGLAWHTTDETLREGFQPFGSVEEAVGNG